MIVANEPEIKDPQYKIRREKLIGKTLEVQSAFDEALTHFTFQISDQSTRSLFEAQRSDISTVYHQSNLNNLRILQQTMWDFERLYRVLNDVHRRHKQEISRLLRLFFALSFELKAARFPPDDLRSRMSKAMEYVTASRGRVDRKQFPFLAAMERYPDIDLNDPILSDELLIDILVRGIVDEDEIRSSIDRTVSQEAEPAWRTVWHWFDRSDKEFARACEEMEKQFFAREFHVTGEILHVFGLRLFLVNAGVLKKDRSDVLSESKQYVDELYDMKRLEPLQSDEANGFRSFGYGGLGVFENETSEFVELATYLEEKRKKAAVDQHPERALALLKEMETDPELYVRRICLTSSSDNWYHRIPILASIKPETFVSSLMQQSPEHQRLIIRAFKSRYEHGGLEGELASEKPWLTDVRTRLLGRADCLSPIGKYRLLKLVEANIAPALGK